MPRDIFGHFFEGSEKRVLKFDPLNPKELAEIMNNAIRVLYLDTCVIVKYFCKEKGSDVVQQIVKDHLKLNCILHTSQITRREFSRVLDKKVRNGIITPEQKRRILHTSKLYFRDVFHILDYARQPNYKDGKDTSYLKLVGKYKKQGMKNWDARHLACVTNYLRIFTAAPPLCVLTSDNSFEKIIKQEGYEVINPEKITFENFKKIISS